MPTETKTNTEKASRSGERHLNQGTTHGDAPDCEQVIRREVHADSKHQQHDADFCKLRGNMHVGHKA